MDSQIMQKPTGNSTFNLSTSNHRLHLKPRVLSLFLSCPFPSSFLLHLFLFVLLPTSIMKYLSFHVLSRSLSHLTPTLSPLCPLSFLSCLPTLLSHCCCCCCLPSSSLSLMPFTLYYLHLSSILSLFLLHSLRFVISLLSLPQSTHNSPLNLSASPISSPSLSSLRPSSLFSSNCIFRFQLLSPSLPLHLPPSM